jgi:hypothetical protein
VRAPSRFQARHAGSTNPEVEVGADLAGHPASEPLNVFKEALPLREQGRAPTHQHPDLAGIHTHDGPSRRLQPEANTFHSCHGVGVETDGFGGNAVKAGGQLIMARRQIFNSDSDMRPVPPEGIACAPFPETALGHLRCLGLTLISRIPERAGRAPVRFSQLTNGWNISGQAGWVPESQHARLGVSEPAD